MTLNYTKNNGLIPVIIQHDITLQVLMLGYMNEEAFKKTQQELKVTFFSRSKQRLWTKGETSGNFLLVQSMQEDCDNDTLLIKALPKGPTCHKGNTSCFDEDTSKGFLYELESIIHERVKENIKDSYVNKLFNKGINKMAQKVGEEAVELIIEAKDNNNKLFQNEAADLLFHFLILLNAKNNSIIDIENILKERNL